MSKELGDRGVQFLNIILNAFGVNMSVVSMVNKTISLLQLALGMVKDHVMSIQDPRNYILAQ